MKVHTRTVFDMATGEVLEDEWYEYEGPVAEGKSGGSTSTNTIQSSEPPEWQTPYIKDFLNQAQSQYQDPGPFYYPGSTVADLNPLQKSGIAQNVNYAQGGAQNIANQAQQGYATGIAAADPRQNPYFEGTAQALINPLTETLQQQVLPGIDSGAVQAGQVGSSRHGIAQGNALQAYSRATSDALSKFGTNAYGQGLNTLSNTLGQTGTIQNAGLYPGQILSGAGDNLNQYEQSLINANIDRFNYGQNLPYNELQRYSGLVGNPLGTTGSQQTTGPAPETGGVSSAIGGAALGLGVNSAAASGALGSTASGFAAAYPWAAPLILGAAAYFS